MLLLTILLIVISYILFIGIKLGFHERLPLAFAPLSLDRIPDRAAKKYGDRLLFTCDRPCTWTVYHLNHRYPYPLEWSANRVKDTIDHLSTLLRIHFKEGERVAVCKQNHFDYHLFIQAIIRGGGIACPINDKFAAWDMEPYLANLEAPLFISDSATLFRLISEGASFGPVQKIIMAESKNKAFGSKAVEGTSLLARSHPHITIIWLEEALQEVKEPLLPVKRGKDDILYLVHSSGTTGFPKAVILKNGAQCYAVRGWLCYVPASIRTDKGYLAVPNNHQAIILTFNSLLLAGGRVHWHSHYDQYTFDAEKVIRELAEGMYTGYFGFPVTYTQLKEVPLHHYDLSKMRLWGSTADASHEVIQRHFVQVGSAFTQLGIPKKGSVYLDAQGSSEVGTPSVLRYITPFTKKFNRRIGRPGSTPFGPDLRIVKENGEVAKNGEVGRFEVRGKTVFAGYWNHPALTAEAFTDGWFFTGDVVRRHKDGHIVQLDRLVDVIPTKNGPVYSLPIEEKIHKHPAVFDACVYGALQEDGAQLPAIAVALREGFEIESGALLRELNHLLFPQEQLAECHILPWNQFPIGVTGKTLKRVFREKAALRRQAVQESNL